MTDMVTTPEAYPTAFQDALNAGDLDRITALYRGDATLHVQTGEIHAGQAAVRAEMAQLIQAGAHITNTLRHTLCHQDTALIIVDYVLRLTAPDAGPVELAGTATNVIRRDPEHGWRMIIANPQGTAG